MKTIKPTYVNNRQAKKLKEKGFGNTLTFPPQQWQVCEWLRVNHNIDIEIIPNYTFREKNRHYWVRLTWIKNNNVEATLLQNEDKFRTIREFYAPQQAISAAFDYILFNDMI